MNWVVLALLAISNLLSGYELSIITMFKNEAPYLAEWVQYHRTAGVDHFYMYDHLSTDNSLEVLQPFVEEGLVEVIPWPYPVQGSYVGEQIKAFCDGIRRSRYQSTWVALIDIDEFLVPLKNSTIKECLKTNFAKADAVYVNWRNFGTSHLTIPLGQPILNKLISCSLASHSDNCIGKSIVRPEKISVEEVWYPHHFVLKQGASYYNGDNQKMEFRGNDLPTDGKHHSKFIVLHHYCLRDEWFYQNKRLARQTPGSGEYNLLLEHYESFNMVPNPTIINFLKKYHLQAFQDIWADR